MEMIMQIFKEDAELQALLRTVLEGICSDFTDEAYSLELLEEKFRSFARPGRAGALGGSRKSGSGAYQRAVSKVGADRSQAFGSILQAGAVRTA